MGVFFSGSSDKKVIAWSLSTLQRIKVLEDAHAESVLSMAASGKLVATGSKDKTIKVWNLDDLINNETTANAVVHLTGHHVAAVNKVVMTDSQLVSGGGDRSIKVWDMNTWQCLRTIAGHTMGVATLTLSPDHSTLISGSSDKTARIWDLATGTEMACLRGHESIVRSVCTVPGKWNEKSQTILTGGYDGTIAMWRREPPADWSMVVKWNDPQGLKANATIYGPHGPEFGARVFSLASDGEKVFCGCQSLSLTSWKLEQ
jgi:WD40 repeat protein